MSEDEETPLKRQRRPGRWFPIGVAIGAGMGVATGNIALWIGVGVAMGIIGMRVEKMRNSDNN